MPAPGAKERDIHQIWQFTVIWEASREAECDVNRGCNVTFFQDGDRGLVWEAVKKEEGETEERKFVIEHDGRANMRDWYLARSRRKLCSEC